MRTMNLDEPILISPFFLVAYSSDGIHFLGKERITSIRSKNSLDRLLRIIPYIDGKRTPRDITKEVPEGLAEAVLADLEKSGILIPLSKFDEISRAEFFLPARAVVPDLPINFGQLTKRRIAVLGFDHNVTSELIRKLACLGISEFIVSDQHSDSRRTQGSESEANEWSMLQELAGINVQRIHSPIDEKARDSLLEADLIVLGNDLRNLETARIVNGLVVKFNAPALLICRFLSELWIIRYRGGQNDPCVECFLSRRCANYVSTEMFGRSMLAKDTAGPLEWTGSQNWTNSHLVTSLIVRDVLTALNDSWTTFQTNSVYVDLEDRVFKEFFIPKLPACETCNRRTAKDYEYRDLTNHPVTGIYLSAFPTQSLTSLITNPLVGIVKNMTKVALYEDEPDVNHFLAECHLPYDPRGEIQIQVFSTAGVSLYEDDAKLRALTEAIERYCGLTYRSDWFSYESFDHIGEDALHPRAVIPFSEDQYKLPNFPYTQYSDNVKIEWIRGISLTLKKPVWVPACAAYLRYNGRTRGERLIPSTSNGLAAGSSFGQSVYNGLLEVIERDSAMLTWVGNKEPPLIDLETSKNGYLIELLNRVKEKGLKCFAAPTTTDVPVPSFIAFTLRQDGGRPHATFGLAAGFDVEHAISKAIQESLLVRHSVSTLLRHGQRIPDAPYKVDSFRKHGLFYADSSNEQMFQNLMKGKKISMTEASDRLGDGLSLVSRGPSSRDLTSILDSLRRLNYDVVVVDVTTDDVRQMGLTVTKVIVPGMAMFDVDHKAPLIGAARLKSLANMQLNPAPHPFW